MFMCSKNLAALLLLSAAMMSGQDAPLDPRSSIKINLPPDSPVALMGTNVGESRATPRGGAMVVDLHMGLSLRNSSAHRIRGITLLVLAQEMTPGGKASVAVPSLDVSPSQAFPVRIDLRLLRPLDAGTGPLVEVRLDGVLFDDFSFYGPNRLNSRRSLTVWETEAQRDRQFLQKTLAQGGRESLQREVIESLARQDERPRIDVRLARGGRSTAVGVPEKVKFAFLRFPDSPIDPMEGWAEISGAEARAPRIGVVNRSNRAIRYVEIGWLVKDRQGREFLAGSVPASDGDMMLPPGAAGQVLADTTMRFSRGGGEPVAIEGMTGFVSQVEYADGKVWVPNRSSLDNTRLLRALAPSPEEQRLTDLYRQKGLNALIEELKKF